MKIGIFDPYLDDLGGGEKYMLTIAECLSYNHKVTLFWDNEKDLDVLLERFSINLSKVILSKNIFAPHISFLERLLASRSFDAIIALSDGSIPFVLSKKLFIHIQQPIQNMRIDLKARIKLKRISSIFCNSYFTKSYIDKTFGVKSEVLYPPVVIERTNVKKENVILHVGRFRVKNVKVGDYKKQSVMIDAFKTMVKNGLFDWKLVIASGVKDEDKDEFNQMVRMAKGFPVDFVINKSNEELFDLYHRAKIYWHASGYGENLNKHPDYAEHFGISTVEAMGAGAVPVVINAGGQKEIVQDGKNGYLWDNLEDFMAKTNNLIKDKDLWEKMSKAAIERSKMFSKNIFCKNLRNIIK